MDYNETSTSYSTSVVCSHINNQIQASGWKAQYFLGRRSWPTPSKGSVDQPIFRDERLRCVPLLAMERHFRRAAVATWPASPGLGWCPVPRGRLKQLVGWFYPMATSEGSWLPIYPSRWSKSWFMIVDGYVDRSWFWSESSVTAAINKANDWSWFDPPIASLLNTCSFAVTFCLMQSQGTKRLIMMGQQSQSVFFPFISRTQSCSNLVIREKTSKDIKGVLGIS